ncbi:BppU family phage baseplate upper protein [Brochothrix campestris]|uniref:BppU N-terminal domain-containing protein n=2 Tax=Brochothrix campestris TaxID=2757 RepID=W7CQR0_9LIST|nr:BppU family phage baseplate upper protein [Brochothrix campestris]EUJ41984.1 hypothetical protein BCAMP_01225 [Brochothrix campestris FSL F6-1037]
MELGSSIKPLSDLNVEFYDQDINTSVLHFILTRCGKPINLSKEKAKSNIVLIAQDGSKIYDLPIVFDEEKGEISYTIPTWFLKHTGPVIGQIYVYQNDNILVTRMFSFTLKDSLTSSYSAQTKLEYIKTFHDLETVITERVQLIEEALANGEDYVSLMNTTLASGKSEIEKIVNQSMSDLKDTATDAQADVSAAATTAVISINAAVTSGQKNIETTSTTAMNAVDKKSEEVLAAIKDGDFWKKSELFQRWNANGTQKAISNIDIDTFFTVGDFYCLSPKNGPTTGNGYLTVLAGNIDITTNSGYYLQIFRSYSTNKVYSRQRKQGATAWLPWLQNMTDEDVSTFQKDQIWKDDGTIKIESNYDMLNVTELKSKNIYVTTPLNGPDTTNSSGYYKRNVRDGGYMEVYFSAFGKNEIYRNAYNAGTSTWLGWIKLATNTDISTLQSSITTLKPVVLWSGSAKGVANTIYKLTRAINLARKIRITYDYPGASGKVAVIDLTNTKKFIIHDLNLIDAGSGGGVYEAQVDFSTLTGFQIIFDAVYDLTTSKTTLDKNTFTLRKVEEVD